MSLLRPRGSIRRSHAVLAFIFRTMRFNSIRTLAARVQYPHALSGALLAALPAAAFLLAASQI